MLSPTPKEPDPTVHDDLLAQLNAQRTRKSEALQRLKRCAEEAAEGSPADSKVFRLYKRDETPPGTTVPPSGIFKAIPDPAERLEARRDQVAKARRARKDGLANLKQTTMQAVATFRETQLLSPAELDERLSGPAPAGA